MPEEILSEVVTECPYVKTSKYRRAFRVPLVSSVGSSKIRDSVTALGSVGGDEDVPRVARPKFRFR